MTNIERATSFLKMAGGGEVRAAYDQFVSPKFFHHNMYFRGDRGSLMTAMEEAAIASPNKSIEVKRTYQDGNTVITHSMVNRKADHQPPIAVVHIFRFEGDQIVELWDLGQPIPTDSPNANGPF